MRSGWQQSTRKPIHLYGNAPVGGSRADQHTSQRNTRYTHAATLGPAPQQPKNRVFDRLPAAGGHTWGSPANSPAAAIAGARAGRAPLGDQVNAIYGVYRRHPPNQCARPRHRALPSCVAPRSSP